MHLFQPLNNDIILILIIPYRGKECGLRRPVSELRGKRKNKTEEMGQPEVGRGMDRRESKAKRGQEGLIDIKQGKKEKGK